MADEIYAGEIDDSPVERETFNACQNCEYSAICVFDRCAKPRQTIDGKTVGDLNDLSTIHPVLGKPRAVFLTSSVSFADGFFTEETKEHAF